jgi:hypothetical protein
MYMYKKRIPPPREAYLVGILFLIWNRIRVRNVIFYTYPTYLSVYICVCVYKCDNNNNKSNNNNNPKTGRTDEDDRSRTANATMSGVIYFKPFMSAEKKMWFILMWIYIYIMFRMKIAWYGKKNRTCTTRNTSSNESHRLALY